MSIISSLINIKRLNLIKQSLNSKESIKLDKKISKIFKDFSPKTMKVVDLLNKFDSPKIDSNALKPYTIGNREVKIINNSSFLTKMIKEINNTEVIGFDTEQKPTFKRGEKQNLISIIQIATLECVYLIQTQKVGDLRAIGEIIANKSIKKVGFGLANDSKQLLKLFGSNPNNFLDLAQFIKSNLLSKNPIGAKNAVSIFLDLKLQKSKNSALSNWEKDNLSPSQVKYASEDATAPLDVYYSIINNFPFILP